MKPIVLKQSDVENLLNGKPVEVKNKKLAVGDKLWVKEVWQTLQLFYDWETGYCDDMRPIDPNIVQNKNEFSKTDELLVRPKFSIAYKADEYWDEYEDDRGFSWRTSVSMPKWASRLTVEVYEIDSDNLIKIIKKEENEF